MEKLLENIAQKWIDIREKANNNKTAVEFFYCNPIIYESGGINEMLLYMHNITSINELATEYISRREGINCDNLQVPPNIIDTWISHFGKSNANKVAVSMKMPNTKFGISQIPAKQDLKDILCRYVKEMTVVGSDWANVRKRPFYLKNFLTVFLNKLKALVVEGTSYTGFIGFRTKKIYSYGWR